MQTPRIKFRKEVHRVHFTAYPAKVVANTVLMNAFRVTGFTVPLHRVNPNVLESQKKIDEEPKKHVQDGAGEPNSREKLPENNSEKISQENPDASQVQQVRAEPTNQTATATTINQETSAKEVTTRKRFLGQRAGPHEKVFRIWVKGNPNESEVQ